LVGKADRLEEASQVDVYQKPTLCFRREEPRRTVEALVDNQKVCCSSNLSRRLIVTSINGMLFGLSRRPQSDTEIADATARAKKDADDLHNELTPSRSRFPGVPRTFTSAANGLTEEQRSKLIQAAYQGDWRDWERLQSKAQEKKPSS
jgi:hypothetical protein